MTAPTPAERAALYDRSARTLLADLPHQRPEDQPAVWVAALRMRHKADQLAAQLEET